MQNLKICFLSKELFIIVAIKNLKGDSIITIDFPLGQCVVKIYKKQFFTQDYLLISLVQNMHMKKQKNLIE